MRRIVLTDQRIINFGSDHIKSNVYRYFSNDATNRASILWGVQAVTLADSPYSTEFIVHVPKQYDYYLQAINQEQ